MEFSKYTKIKNNYCICYFGQSNEYLEQLRLLSNVFSKHFPELNIFIGCKDEAASILIDYPKTIKRSELRSKRFNFAHFYEIRYNAKDHPIKKFLDESGITAYKVCDEATPITIQANIITSGAYPTGRLSDSQIQILERKLREQGFKPEKTNNIKSAGIVAGVESVELFRAASMGKRTILVPTGIGTDLFKKMFPNGEILDI